MPQSPSTLQPLNWVDPANAHFVGLVRKAHQTVPMTFPGAPSEKAELIKLVIGSEPPWVVPEVVNLLGKREKNSSLSHE